MLLHWQVREDRTRTIPREQPKDDALIIGWQISQDFCNIRVVEIIQRAAQPDPIALCDQVFNFDLEQMAEHGQTG